MQLLKKTVAAIFLFIFSFGLPKMFLGIFYHDNPYSDSSAAVEEAITNIGTFGLWLFMIRLCVWALDTTSKDKKLFSLAIPNQTIQLTPIISGIIVGCSNAIRYYKQ